jgi:hypothetical protein
MHRTRLLCRPALAGAATLLALTACSGGSHNAASSPATSHSAAATTSSAPAAGDAGGAFCGQAREFVTQVEAAVTAQQQHNANLGQTLQALSSTLQSISPPPAIASDWHTAVAAVQQLAQDYQGVNLTDPQQVQQLEQKIRPIEGQLAAAGQHIDDYLRTQCGISVGSSASTTG